MTKAIRKKTSAKKTIVVKPTARVVKVTATEVIDWILKEIQIPIFSSGGVNQIEKLKKKRKEWQV